MNYYVYMLKSNGIKPVAYVGYTKDIKKGNLHNSGKELNLQEVRSETNLQRSF